MFDMNRNQWFMIGLILLFLGLQLRLVDTYTLTPEFTQFLAERTGHPLAAVNANVGLLTPSERPIARKSVRPPEWIGWFIASMGFVFILHCLAMKKPE